MASEHQLGGAVTHPREHEQLDPLPRGLIYKPMVAYLPCSTTSSLGRLRVGIRPEKMVLLHELRDVEGMMKPVYAFDKGAPIERPNCPKLAFDRAPTMAVPKRDLQTA